MKKIFLLAIAATTSMAAFSQVKWGVQAHGNLGSASINSEVGAAFKKSSLLGFGAGVLSVVDLNQNLSLRSSLNLLQKGAKFNSSFSFGEGDDAFSAEASATNKLYYAELPVQLTYGVKTTAGKFFFGAGPSLGYGLFGKSKVTSSNPFDPSEKETQSFDAFKKADSTLR